MYLYFNENGVLKEIINDEALRQGNYNINKMYIYIENRIANSVNVQYLLSDGTQTTTEVFSTIVTNAEIPFDRKRDLYYFKYYTPYRFIVVNLETDINGISPLDVAGWVHCSLSANLVTSNILQLGEVTFNVEADGLKHNTIPTEYLTLSDYLYFRSLLNSKQNVINGDNKLPAEYIEEDNTHKFVTNIELERLNSVGLIELNGSLGILTEEQLEDLEKPFCFIKHNDLVYSLNSVDGSLLTFTYEHATKTGVIVSRIVVVPSTHSWSKLSDVTHTYNPMTTTGDIIYAESSGVMTRLGIGNNSQVLAVVDGRPAWVNATPIQAEGDLIVGDSEGKPKRLAKGNNGQVLKMVSGEPTWSTDETGMANPMTTQGDLIVGGSSGTPYRIGKGNEGQILKIAGGLPAWADLPPVDQNYNDTSNNAQSGKAVKQAIDSAISTVYRPQGSSSVSALNSAPHLESMNGWVFNLTDSGTLTNYDNTTTSVIAGDNVVFLWNGGNWKWDSLSGFVDLSDKQDTLVSGTNIKTIDGNSILGSGDIDTQNIGIITLSGDSGTLTSDQKAILQNKPVTFIVRSDIVYTLTNTGGYSYYFQSHQQSATADVRKVITINASSSTYTWTYNYYTYTRNPMTTTGDMIKGSADGTMTRLPKGTAGQFLKSGASDVEWGDGINRIEVSDITQLTSAQCEILKVGDIVIDTTDNSIYRVTLKASSALDLVCLSVLRYNEYYVVSYEKTNDTWAYKNDGSSPFYDDTNNLKVYAVTQSDIDDITGTVYTFTDEFKDIVTSGRYILKINDGLFGGAGYLDLYFSLVNIGNISDPSYDYVCTNVSELMVTRFDIVNNKLMLDLTKIQDLHLMVTNPFSTPSITLTASDWATLKTNQFIWLNNVDIVINSYPFVELEITIPTSVGDTTFNVLLTKYTVSGNEELLGSFIVGEGTKWYTITMNYGNMNLLVKCDVFYDSAV